MKIMVSACLMGDNCKYSGGNNLNEKVLAYAEECDIVKVCPEMLGGLTTPREPCEIRDGVVVSRDGRNVDKEFRLGAEKALELAKSEKVDLVVLQSRSPSCGVGIVYDGTFSGKKVTGNGVFAQLAIDAGFQVVDVEDI